jgi:hypothetical protein
VPAGKAIHATSGAATKRPKDIGQKLAVGYPNLPAAFDSYLTSLAIADRLAKTDPGNAGWQAALAGSHGKLGQLYVRMGRGDQALDMFLKGRAIVVALAERSLHVSRASIRR